MDDDSKLRQNIEIANLPGISVIPLNGKKPIIAGWTKFCKEKASLILIENHTGNIGICGGFENLEVLDIDNHFGDADNLLKFVSDNFDISEYSITKTASGGFHIYFRCESVEGNQKLAQRINSQGKPETLIETRGKGGQVVYYPNFIQGSIETIPVITPNERTELLEICRACNEVVKDKSHDNPVISGQKPGDAYNSDILSIDMIKDLLLRNGWTSKDNVFWTRPGKDKGISATLGKVGENKFYVFSSNASPFEPMQSYSPFAVKTILEYNGDFKACARDLAKLYNIQPEKPKPENVPYIRVGINYYKKIRKTDRWEIERTELKPWKKDEIKQDHGTEYLQHIQKYDDFTLNPDNRNYQQVIKGCYNRYNEFKHKPAPGEWTWTKILLEHIFGEQYELGIRYFQIIYLHPGKMLPILALVSKIRQTGKTTFVNCLDALFGANLVIIGSADLANSFNQYATANIVVIEETLIEKQLSVEKIKSLATAKTVTINEKFMQQYKLPFYGKIILTSNNEDRFARIDQEEVRFFVRKLGRPKFVNHNIESDLLKEIPAFLHYLTMLPPVDFSTDRTGFTPDELKNEALEALKKESKTALYHDLVELFTDFFNNVSSQNECYCTVRDIKDRWFTSNNQIEHRYIKHVITNEFNLELQPIQRYAPFGDAVIRKVGTPYIFTKELFIENIDILDNGTDKLPF